MTLQYEDIFSIFLSKITDYSFLEYDENFIKLLNQYAGFKIIGIGTGAEA